MRFDVRSRDRWTVSAADRACGPAAPSGDPMADRGLSDRGCARCSGRDGRCRRLAAGRTSGHPIAVGHRVVHGGPDYSRPVLHRRGRRWPVSSDSCRWRRCTSPTIWRRSVAAARTCPTLPQVACFDTAFHRRHDARRRSLCYPAQLSCRGRAALWLSWPVLRYIAQTPAEVAPDIAKRPRDRCPSRQRRVDVRAQGRAQRREHHGLHRARRPADGHASRARSIPASCSI